MKTIELGQEGLDYLQSFLKGDDLLSQSLLHLRLEEGKIFTFLPDDVDWVEVSLKEGGLGQRECREDLNGPVVSLLSDFVRQSRSNFALIEATSLPREKLPIWCSTTPSGFHYVTSESTTRKARHPETQEQIPMIGVYGVLAADHSDSAYVREFLDEAFPFRQIGIMTSLPEGYLPRSGETVALEWLETVAARTLCIFAGAFDGSGWIVWFLCPDVEIRALLSNAALPESAAVFKSPN